MPLIDAGAKVRPRANAKPLGGTGTHIAFEAQPITAKSLDGIRGIEGPVFLHFKSCCFAPGALKSLDGMPNLRLLGSVDAIGDAKLREISALPALEGVGFEDDDISAGGLAFLTTATRLQGVGLGGVGIDDRALALLAGHDLLYQVVVSSPSITDEGLRHIGSIPNVTELQLNNCGGITDAGLRHLAGLKHLGALYLSHTEKVGGAGLAHLRSLDRLKLIMLDEAKVTDAGLAGLAALDQLESLELSYTPITDEGIGQLGRMRSLGFLGISSTSITDAGLAKLPASCAWRIDAVGTRVTAAARRSLPRAHIELGRDLYHEDIERQGRKLGPRAENGSVTAPAGVGDE